MYFALTSAMARIRTIRRASIVRRVEQETGRPIAVLADLQGPKLRIGTFADGPIKLAAGASFSLDLDDKPGNQNRVGMPHPEIFQSLKPSVELLARSMPLVWVCARSSPTSPTTLPM
jgi:pyruvate kinase